MTTEQPHLTSLLGCARSVWRVLSAGFRTLVRRRPGNTRRWITAFTLTYCITKATDSGAGSVQYLFYR